MPVYHMQKSERAISDRKELLAILMRGKFVSISLCRENEPYIVTLSYGFDKKGNVLYFHTAFKGLKIDFIRQNPYVCATIIEDLGYHMNRCEHGFRSVVLWGRLYEVESLQEKKHGMQVLLNHLENNPDIVKRRSLQSDDAYKGVNILRLEIDVLTGKEGS